MAAVEADPTWLGVHLELNHDEVQTVTSGPDIDQAIRSLIGVLPAVYDAALAVAARYIAVETPTMQELDQGHGVSLLIPWLAIWWGHWWLITPNTR